MKIKKFPNLEFYYIISPLSFVSPAMLYDDLPSVKEALMKFAFHNWILDHSPWALLLIKF